MKNEKITKSAVTYYLALNEAIKSIKETFSDGEIHYCPPTINVDFEGRHYQFYFYEVNNYVHLNSVGLNYYQFN